MKRITIYLFVAAFASSTLFYACSKQANNQSSDNQNNNDHDGVVVGHFLKDGSGIPEMDLSFEEAVYLIQENNNFTKSEYSYTYTEAWLETLANPTSGPDYYLASRATVIDQLGDTVYSCCSFYLLLEEDGGGNLILSAPGTQYNCNGKCCSSCDLKPADASHTAPWCDCTTAITVDDCAGKTGYCTQNTSITIGGSGTN